MKFEKGMGVLSLLLVIALVGVIFVPAVSAQERTDGIRSDANEPALVVIGDCTNVLIKDVISVSDLKSYGIIDPEKLNIPEGITRYELVTFDHAVLNKEMQSTVLIQISGKYYTIVLNRMNFESLDDCIDSYEGSIQGVEGSDVLLTTGKNVLVGSIIFDNETFWIAPVEPRARAEKSQSPLHIIYSSEDVRSQEKPAIIDYGPVSSPESDETVSLDQSIRLQIEDTKQFYTVNILVATDNQFYQDETNWKATAQDIIATANQQFGRDDIQVSLCVMDYSDSRRYQLSNHPAIMSDPLGAFIAVYPESDLDARSSDLGIYLGGYDKTGTEIGLADGFTNNGRHAWAQMVTDWYDLCYWGTAHGRRCVSIHELGHNFNAHHEDTPGYNQAYAFNGGLTHTVVWSYFLEHLNCYEFSSDNYHGDATHDNARAIREAKAWVAGYV
ncbi:MAG: M12 family metallo-peptidase [Euryarchaeota archaeon]|nr:M12 family metallo-peptidase [Euryarchaeota archaeon]